MKSLIKYLGASAALLVLVASLAGNVLLYKQVRALKSDPAYAASKENDTLIAAVRRLMVLPDETPTIATVFDPEKLKGQSFFENAKKGDKVLIFSAAKKAVLYDPVANKIVELAPLSAANGAASPAGDTAVSGTTEGDASATTANQKKSTSKTKSGTTSNVNAATGADASQ